MGFEFNLAPMQESLRWYAQATDKALPVIVNKKMKDVVIKTMANTPRVLRATISDELQQYYATKAYVMTGKRAGQRMIHPKPLYRPWPLARAIIAQRMRKKGISPRSVSAADFENKIDAMIKSRLSSDSYALSGWIPAAKLFGAGTGYGAVPQWSVHGDGVLATVGNAIAQISNDVVIPWDADSPGYKEVFQAVQDALDDVAEDTLAYADTLLSEMWGQAGSRSR